MGALSRKTWAIVGVVLLGLGCALMTFQGRGLADPRELAAQAQLALRNRRWDHAETLLNTLSHHGALTPPDILLRAELELGRGRVDEALRLLSEIPDSDTHAAEARLAAGKIERSRHRARSAESFLFEACR